MIDDPAETPSFKCKLVQILPLRIDFMQPKCAPDTYFIKRTNCELNLENIIICILCRYEHSSQNID